MNIYLSTEENFDNNGLGFLIDCLSANVVEELNGEYGLNITYPINSSLSDYLVAGNIIKADVGDNNYQLFRISQVEKDFKTISLYARHIYYDLLDNFIEDSAPTNLDCASAAKWLLDRAEIKTKFEVYSDAIGVHSARYVRRNPVECFMGDIDNSLVNLYNVEIERDNFLIKFLKQRGNNKNVKLIIGKNIKDINVNIDISSLYTKIMPLGYDGLMLPEKYVSSPLINDYPTPKIGKYEFSNIKYDPEDEEAYHTLEEAYQALRDETNLLFDAGIDKPVINIKIDWLELSKTKEYYEKYNFLEKVSLGDTITAEILGLNFETRVIKTTYNVLTKQIDTFEIGTFKPTFQNTVNSIVKNVEKINPTSILEEARDNATKLLTSAMGGYVYKTNNELFIMDTDDPKTATKVWRWNLNGLGYSKNGINGPYEIAITQDGSINADFITSGKINTNLIEGYEELVMAVNSFKDLTTIVENIGIVNLDRIMTSELLFLHIYPTNTDLSYLYPSKSLFPSEDLFMTTRDLVATKVDSETGEDVEVLRYTLPCDLHYIDGNIKDELIIDYENKQMYCIHRVGFNEDGDKIQLEEEQKEYFVYNGIQFEAGTYKLFMESFEDAYINVRYSKQNEFTSQFATHVDLSTSITLLRNQLELKVSEKLDKDEIIASLNLAVENDLGIIELKGNHVIIDSDNFKLDKLGNINANNATLHEVNVEGGNINLYDTGGSSASPTITIANEKDSTFNTRISSYGLTNNYRYIAGTFKSRIGGFESEYSLTNRQYGEPDAVFKFSPIYLTYAIGDEETGDVLFSWNTQNINAKQFLIADTPTASNNVVRLRDYQSWVCDKRYKKNIKDSEYQALNKILSINHKEFDYKYGGHVENGYVADELEEIDKSFIFESGEDKIKHPQLSSIIPAITKAIQEQQTIINKLEKRILVIEKGI